MFQVEVSDLIDLESFFTAKETINKMTRQLTEREKIIANEATNKGLKPSSYLLQSNELEQIAFVW